MVAIYAVASILRQSDDEWFRFCSHPYWTGDRQRPQFAAKHREKAIEHVARFVIGRGASASRPMKSALGKLRTYWDSGATALKVGEELSSQQRNKQGQIAVARFKLMLGPFHDDIAKRPEEFLAVATLAVSKVSARGTRLITITSFDHEADKPQLQLPL